MVGQPFTEHDQVYMGEFYAPYPAPVLAMASIKGAPHFASEHVFCVAHAYGLTLHATTCCGMAVVWHLPCTYAMAHVVLAHLKPTLTLRQLQALGFVYEEH